MDSWDHVPRLTSTPGREGILRLARGGRVGAGNRVRTGDIQLGKLTLYQLSYARIADQQYNQSPARGQSGIRRHALFGNGRSWRRYFRRWSMDP